MFVPANVGNSIEAMRQILDPVQARRIPAHVTLCREDEITGLAYDNLAHRISGLHHDQITLDFGRPSIFCGHGILLACIAGERSFHALRVNVLDSTNIRVQKPHITLAHPRNPRATGNSMDNALLLPDIFSITFPTVCLIEQMDGGPWAVLEEFSLG